RHSSPIIGTIIKHCQIRLRRECGGRGTTPAAPSFLPSPPAPPTPFFLPLSSRPQCRSSTSPLRVISVAHRFRLVGYRIFWPAIQRWWGRIGFSRSSERGSSLVVGKAARSACLLGAREPV